MKVHANRYGLIEAHEVAFALRAYEADVRASRDARHARAARRAAWRERWARRVGAALRRAAAAYALARVR